MKIKHSIITSLLLCFGLLLLIGCTSSTDRPTPSSYTPPVTHLNITLQSDTADVDTAAITSEIQGLLQLTYQGSSKTEYSIASLLRDSLLHLEIEPQIQDAMKKTLNQILSLLVQHPSSLPPFNTYIQITEQDTSTLALLELSADTTFPLRPNLHQVGWAFKQKDSPDLNRFINATYVITYLRYGLTDSIPSLMYKYQLGEGTNKISRAANKLYKVAGPFTASYDIKATAPQADQLWDSLRSHHHLNIFGGDMTLRWATFDFDIQPFSPLLHADSLIQESVNKLTTAKPYLFHLLIAPELSRSITSFSFKKPQE